MPRDEAVRGEHTRRAFAKYGGTVALGGLLAGCTGGADSGSAGAGETDEASTDAASGWAGAMTSTRLFRGAQRRTSSAV